MRLKNLDPISLVLLMEWPERLGLMFLTVGRSKEKG